MEIQCICGTQYKKQEFKKHFKNCNKFLEKFKDFDYKISTIISSYFKSKKNASIIIFLLERYIKLLNHRISHYKINIRKVSSDFKQNKIQNLAKDLTNPFYNINNQNIVYNNNFNNGNDFNGSNFFSKLNYKTCNDLNQNNFNIDESLIRKNCMIIKKNKSEKKVFQIKNNLNNKINLFQKRNEISFEIIKQINNPFFVYKNLIQENLELENQFITQGNFNCYLISIGSKINKEESEIIMDFCKEQFIENKGKISNEITKYLSKSFKSLFSGDWFIIISNIEYKEIYYNLSSSLSDKTIVFYLNNKKICVIRYF